ncbi:Neurogenic locus notch-like protein 2 [Hondaea fermentalgiana]|uniref:Neurogenic locus notch-like protein 2 n=1 Tax=Hondaea fermentalgiana TaxID=2315210 RepID=A0A2R5GHC3_9STRA|nr:Neurogenic locus notch-like protein 2 [Hondaea fermentalgiana]|eukprot:GBG30306.1 Neurogenic locus notch-like protein 2 [Hondaea fermentalgiana]
MKIAAILVAILAFTGSSQAAGSTDSTPRRFLGNGEEILHGRGTRLNPFNKPKHDAHRALVDAISHRTKHQAHLREELAKVQKRSPPRFSRRLTPDAKALRARALQTNSSEDIGEAVDSLLNLDECWRTSELGDDPFGNVTHLHPCYNELCQRRKSSTECLEVVYDFCCDRSLDDCEPSDDMKLLRTQASCDGETCSRFMGEESYSEPGDTDFKDCYFSNASLCENECSGRFWDMIDSYAWGACEWNKNCFANQLWNYEPEVQNVVNRIGKVTREASGGKTNIRRLDHSSNFRIFSSKQRRDLQDMDVTACNPERLVRVFDMVEAVKLDTCMPEGEELNYETCQTPLRCIEPLLSYLNSTFDETSPEVECFDELTRDYSYENMTAIWPEEAGDVPDMSTFKLLVDYYEVANQCWEDNYDENYNGGGDGKYDEGYYYDSVDCDPDSLVALFNKFPESKVDECIGDFNTTTCSNMYGCLPNVLTFLGADSTDDLDMETNPLLRCAARMSFSDDFDVIWPTGVEKPDPKVVAYGSFVFRAFMNCEKYNTPLGDTVSDNWNYSTECQAAREGNLTTCKDTCCELHDRLMTMGNVSAFPTDSSMAGFTCGQMVRAGESKEDVLACLRSECGGCYETGTGLYGPPGMEAGGQNDNPYSDDCIKSVHAHCVENPDDENCGRECPHTGCSSNYNDNCPCENNGCTAYYDADFAEGQVCTAVHEAVVNAFIAQGFLYPESSWTREYLEAMSGVILTPPGVFELPGEVESLAEEKGCAFLDEIVSCVNATTSYCNSDRGFWSSSCRRLSTCGDGLLSWGEACDDGNTLPFQDGCHECNWVPDGWYCPGPGKPCEVCLRDPNVDQYRPARPGLGTAGRASEESGCPFCMNRRLENRLNPCLTDECKLVNDYPSAQACDEVVADYCAELGTHGMHDPGCTAYVNKSTAFAVPTIPECSFAKRTVEVHGEYLKKMSFMVIECPLIDPTGVAEDFTPMVPYWSPLYALDSDELAELDEGTKKILEIKSLADEDELVPLTALTDHETTPYDDVRVVKVESDMRRAIAEHDNPYRQRVARLSLKGSKTWEDEECEWPHGFRELALLPPCDDAMATIARQGLKELKFRGDVNDNWDFRDFVDISTADLSKFACNPKPNTVQLSIPISATRLEWVANSEQEVERPERVCDLYYQEHGEWPDSDEQCKTFDELFQENLVEISFGERLYQQGCIDDECEERIARCELVPVVPASPKVDLEQFELKADVLLDTILEIADSQTWAELKKALVSVSALAASTPIAGALDLFNSVTVQGSITKFRKDVRYYCPHDWGSWNSTVGAWVQNPDWLADPCCNWELQALMCCPVQDVPTGTVNIITGFDDNKLDVCQNPDQIRQTFANLFTTVTEANKQAAELARKVDPKEFENVWEFEDDCRELIYRSKDVRTEADCYCKYSTVRDGSCVTSEKDMPRCYAECFRAKYETENPYVLFYLKEQWGIAEPESDDVDDENDRFAEAWVEHMTEYGCRGDESWHEDIGYSGYSWTCNSTCQEEYACDYWSVFNRFIELERERTGEWIDEWTVRNSEELCAEYNGTRKCSYDPGDGECYDYQCRIAALEEEYEMPCDTLNSCYNECSAPCNDKDTCLNDGGYWIEDWNSCCPAHAYFRNDTGYAWCSLVPEGKPDSWTLRDEVCCSAWDGEWRRNEWGGECCLGEWRAYEWDDQEYWYCQEHYDTWEACHECHTEVCEPLSAECYTCWQGSEDCCGEEYVSQNETACLSYTRCNNRELGDHECYGDEPLCAYEWGWPASEPATCEIYLWETDDGQTQANCEALGYFWLESRWGGTYCGLEMSPNATSQDCFQLSACEPESWEKRFPGWEAPANGNWDYTYCESGCYVSDDSSFVTNREHYEWGYSGCSFQIDLGNGETMWAGGRWNEEQSTCLVNSWNLREMVHRGAADTPADACSSLTGEHKAVSSYFLPSKFATQEQCEAGRCEGTVNNWRRHPETGHYTGEQPWTEEQCFRLSEKQCDQWCPICRSDISENFGGCFHNETFERYDAETEELCMAAEENLAWFRCPEPEVWLDRWEAVDEVCNTNSDDIPSQVFEELGCRADYQRCPEDRCEEKGQCMNIHGHVFDFRTEHCTDPSWTHGDRFWGEEIVTEGDVSYSTWVSCPWSHRDEIDGACIGERDSDWGCGYDKWYLWHVLGCKKEGFYNAQNCTDAGYTWHDPIRRAEDCTIPGCKLNRWDVREYSAEECEYCGGEVVDMAYWQGGNLMRPFMRKFKYYPDGNEITPINEWIPGQAGYLVQQELEYPVMRAYAQFKMQELLVKYNLYSKVLSTIACDCSSGSVSDESCFDSQADGALSTSQDLPMGQTTEAGTGVTVVTGLISAERRRLQESSANTTSVAVTEYSAGIYAKHEPCTGDDASTFDALVVTNEHGLVVGQLLGNGRGLNITGDVESVLLCLPARDDIALRDSLFDVFGVGKREDDGTISAMIFENDDDVYIERKASQVCIETVNSGIYYPIARVADSLVSSTLTCTGGCENGVCALASDETTECVCACGFSGSSCDMGCPSYCHDNGVCDDASNTCTCTQGSSAPLYIGAACGRKNCPLNENGVSCSGNGYCSVDTGDAVCTCDSGWMGDDCGTRSGGNSTGSDIGYGELEASSDDSDSFGFAVSTSPPTSGAPTKAPTPAPTKPAPEPLVTLNVKMTTNLLGTSSNNTDLSETFGRLKSELADVVPEGIRDKVDIKVQVKQKTQGTLDLTVGAALDDASLGLIERSIELNKCIGVSFCNVTAWAAGSSTRRQLSESVSISYSIDKTIDEDDESPETDDAIEPAELSNLIVVQAAAEGVEVEISVDAAPTPTVQSSLVVKAVPKESALQSIEEAQEGEAFDVTSLQQSFSNAGAITSAVESSTGVTVESVEADLCEGRTCSGNGECVADEESGTSSCECSGSWTGVQCEVGTLAPTLSPTLSPTASPTLSPTASPTGTPSEAPTTKAPTTPSPTVINVASRTGAGALTMAAASLLSFAAFQA